ncbi:unnamed protein product, partial [Closterium sp. Naga37s-1]
VARIFQRYHCGGRTDGGTVENVVRWNLPAMMYPPLLTTPSTGLMTVTAEFGARRDGANFELRFERDARSGVRLNEQMAAFLAPDGHMRAELGLWAKYFSYWLQSCLPCDSFIRDNPISSWT